MITDLNFSWGRVNSIQLTYTGEGVSEISKSVPRGEAEGNRLARGELEPR